MVEAALAALDEQVAELHQRVLQRLLAPVFKGWGTAIPPLTIKLVSFLLQETDSFYQSPGLIHQGNPSKRGLWSQVSDSAVKKTANSS